MGAVEARETKIPAEAVDLYTRYIHGEVSRRDFFAGVSRYAVGGLTATALVEALMPNYALGQQVARNDERISASYETVPSPDGNGFIRGYLVRPFGADSRSETPDRLPGVLVIHENRGLNPHTEDVARRFALENFMAFAPDALTSVGGYPNDDYRGGQLFGEVDRGRMAQDFVAAARWLKARPDCNGRIAATGFCFGGGYAFLGAARLGIDAGIAFHSGKISHLLEEAGNVKCPLSFHWGDEDAAAPMDEIEKVQAVFDAMDNAEITIYPGAKHGFMQPTNPPAYDAAVAAKSWTRALEILKGL